MISSIDVIGLQRISGHSTSENLELASKDCLQKYIPTSDDSSVDYKKITDRALYALSAGKLEVINTPDGCCLGVCVSWIESFLNYFDNTFDYHNALILHQEYWESIKATKKWDAIENKKKECVDLTYKFLSEKLHEKEINIDVEPCPFYHVKSSVASLSQAFFLLPKCSTLLILHGLGENNEFQGHNFTISWDIKACDEGVIIFLDPAGTQVTWSRFEKEAYTRFFIRIIDHISDIIGMYIKGDKYTQEEVRIILLYKGTPLETITGVD